MLNFFFETVDYKPKLKVRRVLLCLLGVALVITAGYVILPRAYRLSKGWRSHHLAAQAETLMSQGDWAGAAKKAEVAFLLKPTNPAATRAVARVLTHSTNATALQFWQQLENIGQATADDRRACVEFAIRAGAMDLAALELQRLLGEAPNAPVNVWLASQFYLALGDFSKTVESATRARLLDPANRQYLLFLSSLLFDSPEPARREEARTNLWGIARDSGALGLEALDFLALKTNLPPEQREELISLLQQHPLSGIRQQLLICDQQIRQSPQRRDEIFDQVVAQCRTSTIPATANQVAVWLNQNDQFERTLLALPFERALTNQMLFMPRVDALASLGRWAELEKILENPRLPLEAVYLEAFRARCSMQLDNATAAHLHWMNALSRAERNPSQLQWLTIYAEKCGNGETAKKACRSLIGCLPNPRPAFQALEKLIMKSGTTAELRDLIGEMLRHWPQDPALQNDFAYLNLLLRNELAASCRTAEDLLKQSPESVPFRTTFALALYRQNDFTNALQAYAGRQYDWPRALPGQRAVYAAVLAANDKTREAREHAQAIPIGHLCPEELELIQPLR